MFMEVLLVELVHTWDLNTLRCLYRQHGTRCAWAKGLFYHLHFLPNVIKRKINVDKNSRLPKSFRRKVLDPSTSVYLT